MQKEKVAPIKICSKSSSNKICSKSSSDEIAAKAKNQESDDDDSEEDK